MHLISFTRYKNNTNTFSFISLIYVQFLFFNFIKVPLNNKETMLQRQISIDRDETETGLEALEEPLKARKRRESRQGIFNITKKKSQEIFFKFIMQVS